MHHKVINMSSVSYEMTAIATLAWLVILRPIEAGSSRTCSPCVDKFYQDAEGLTLRAHIYKHCSVITAFLECLDRSNCDLKADGGVAEIIAPVSKKFVSTNCGRSIGCDRCLETYYQEIYDLSLSKNKAKYCSIDRNFLKCSEEENCKPDHQGSVFEMELTGVKQEAIFICGDICLECLETHYREVEPIVSTHNKTAHCRVAKKFMKCWEDNKCDTHEKNDYFKASLNHIQNIVWFTCGYDSKCRECHAVWSREQKRLKETDENAKWCSVYEKFWNCSKKNYCDPREQGLAFYIDLYLARFVIGVNCAPNKCNHLATQICISAKSSQETQLTANMLRERARCTMWTVYHNCIYDYGCLEDPRTKNLRTKLQKIKNTYRCDEEKCDLYGYRQCNERAENELSTKFQNTATSEAKCWLSGRLVDCLQVYQCDKQRNQASNVRAIYELMDHCSLITHTSKTSDKDGALLCKASWVVILMAAIVNQGFCLASLE